MDNKHPLNYCSSLTENWSELLQQWEDEFNFAYPKSNPIGRGTNNPKIKSARLTIDKYIRTAIESVFKTSYSEVILQFKNVILDSEKIGFLEGIFSTSEKLIENFKNSNVKNEYSEFVQDLFVKLNKKLHDKYDNDLFILRKETENIPDKAKLRFNLSRAELIHFFILLKDSNIIDNSYTDYALATFISKSFMCFNQQEQKYTSLKRVKKYIRDIKSKEQFSESAVEKVKDKIKASKINFKEYPL